MFENVLLDDGRFDATMRIHERRGYKRHCQVDQNTLSMSDRLLRGSCEFLFRCSFLSVATIAAVFSASNKAIGPLLSGEQQSVMYASVTRDENSV